jgi:hypothetical protein
MAEAQNLRTVRQLAEECPAFSEWSIRKLIAQAELNGLSKSVVRLGRRVLIDRKHFDQWLESHRESPVN